MATCNAPRGLRSQSAIPGSHDYARQSFDTGDAAANYPGIGSDEPRDRREWRCIAAALDGLPRGAKVLDLPSGSGRMTARLLNSGYRVMAGDSSLPMLRRLSLAVDDPHLQVACCDATATGFASRSFDAVLCNRLLHHLADSESRRAVLRELARVSRGPVVVSFFSTLALDTLGWQLKGVLRGRRARDRRPIWPSALAADVQSVGLRVAAWRAARLGVSRQWYATCVAR